MRRLAESRLAAEIVTRWALPKRDAAKIVRYVLNEVVDDLRQCRLDTPDPDLRIGIGVAVTRVMWAGSGVGEATQKASSRDAPTAS